MVVGSSVVPEGAQSSAVVAQVAESVGRVGVRRLGTVEVKQVLETLVMEREGCSMLPAGPYPLSYLESSWQEDLGYLERGVKVRCLYQADSVRVPGVLQYLSRFAAAGAEVRVSTRVTHRTIIADRRVVLIAEEMDQLRAPYLLVEEPALVRSVHSNFVQAWNRATAIGFGHESIDLESAAEILLVMQTGVTDEVAAKQLGVSLRTVRRRVATVMELLGASSRFEAGVKAVKAGWI